MRMPRGGTFDSDSSNNLVFSGSAIGWVFRQGFEFKNSLKTVLNGG